MPSGDNIDLNELLKQGDMLQVDLEALETVNQDTMDSVQVKTEPLSDQESDNDDDEDFVINYAEKNKRNTEKPTRSSPRNKDNKKIYGTDSISDEDE